MDARGSGVIVERILETTRADVTVRKASLPASAMVGTRYWHDARRGFRRAIETHTGRCIIAEIKRASPSRGVIRAEFDPASHARAYATAGATCLSVLTDRPFFQGALDHLAEARGACRLPLLRKDFVVDPYQVTEARAFGADAILLIVAALSDGLHRELAAAAAEHGLDVLTEVHDEADLDAALGVGASLIGINNRDLRTFAVTTEVTHRLMRGIPAGVTVISESGLSDAHELAALEALGVKGFLIGEAFMAAPDPGEALARLLPQAGERQEDAAPGKAT